MLARLRRPLKYLGGGAGAFLIVVAGLLAGTGWLYVLRGLHWLDVGPRVGDALPLLQLASFDGQPLLRVLVAWGLAGVLTGVALTSVPWPPRVAVTLILGLLVLLVASQASYALARNLRFASVLFSRRPGFGPVLEALVFAAASALPRPLADRQRPGTGRSLLARLTGFDDRRLRGG